MTITLREITEDNAQSVLALRCTPDQERFVTSVTDSLAEAEECPRANPWFRAVYADGRPVGFVMLSWDVEPQPPEIIGPWFLWKLLIDHRHQGKGYGREVVRQVVELVRGQGATELLTSHVPGEGVRPASTPGSDSFRQESSTRRARSSCGDSCMSDLAEAPVVDPVVVPARRTLVGHIACASRPGSDRPERGGLSGRESARTTAATLA